MNSLFDCSNTTLHFLTGSIGVEFVIAGSKENVKFMLSDLCEEIKNGTLFHYDGHNLTLLPFMTVNSRTFYGVECGDKVSHLKKNLH
jgi:hypothetical protein